MKFLDQILRRKPQAKTPKKTVQEEVPTVEGLDPQTLENIALAQTGKNSDIELRTRAIKQLPYTKVICDLAFDTGTPAALERAAKQRLAELLDRQQLTETQLAKDVNDAYKLLDIAGYSGNETFQQNTIAKIADDKKLLQICLSTHSAGVRKIIVDKFEDKDSLRELSNGLKTRDKVAYRIAKSKLDKFRADENEAKALQDSILQICVDAEEHSKRSFERNYAPRVTRLEARWAEVANAADAVSRDRYESAMKICHALLEDRATEVAEIQAFEKACADAPLQRKVILEKIRKMLFGLAQMERFSNTDADNIRKTLAEHRKAWQGLTEYDSPPENDVMAYTQTCDAVEEVVRSFLTRGTIAELRERIAILATSAERQPAETSHDVEKDRPEEAEVEIEANDEEADSKDSEENQRDFENIEEKLTHQYTSDLEAEYTSLKELLRPVLILPNVHFPENVSSAVQLIDDWEKDRKEKAEYQKKTCQTIVNLIRKSQSSLKQGRLKQALGIRHSIDEKIPTLESIPENIESQLGELDKAIEEMVDWQAYAVIPKKEALIGAMNRLIGTDMVPDVLAGKIKKLQAEWSSLSQSGKDRHEDLWEKFNEAAHTAYEPCRKYFAELAEQRKANLEKRKALVKQLEDYYENQDWDTPDWTSVEKILHRARKELYSYAPVDRSESEPVKMAFDKVMSAIQEKLEIEYSANKSRKEQTIEQAKNLVDITNLPDAISRAKELQALWKTIGHCRYKDNERLWKTFRKHCDAVFERRANIEAELNQQRQDCLDQANDIIEKIEALSKLQGQDILDARSEKEQLQNRYRELGDIPAEKRNPLQKKYRSALDNFDKSVDLQRRSLEAEMWQGFFELSHKINQLDKTNDDLISALRDEIEAVNRWPGGGKEIIAQKLESILANAESIPDQNQTDQENQEVRDVQEQLRLVCIRAEILAGCDSPQEDKALRMEYQVKLLQKGLGNAATDESNAGDLAKDWVSIGKIDDRVYQKLWQRFDACWKKINRA